MIFKTKNSSVEHNSSSCLQQSKEKLSTHYNLFLSVTKEKPFSIMINRYFSFNECNETQLFGMTTPLLIPPTLLQVEVVDPSP